MSAVAVVRLIAMREIRERVQGRLTRIVTVLTALLVVAGIVIPAQIHSSSAPTRIGLVGPIVGTLAPALEQRAHRARVAVVVTGVTTAAAARARVLAGTLDVALLRGARTARAEVKESLDPTIAALLAATIDDTHLRETLARAGVPPGTVRAAVSPVPLATTALAPAPSDRTARDIAALAASFLMYMSLVLYGAAVANGVAQEKTSRTAEVLLASVRPGELLTGKVLGIGLCGLGQLGIAAIAGLLANAAVHSTKIPSSVWALLPGFLVWFLLGYALYAFALAAAGALVARQEEVQFVSMPFSFLLIAGYLLVYAAIGSPDATWLRVVSFVPPLSASLMPARIALGHVAAWELPVDALLMIVSIYLTARIAGRIYAHALIRGGARISWRAAVRLRAR